LRWDLLLKLVATKQFGEVVEQMFAVKSSAKHLLFEVIFVEASTVKVYW